MGMQALGNWEQYDTRQDAERILNRPIDGEGTIIVFPHEVMLISFVPGLVCIWYFYISSESEGIYGWAIEHFPGCLLAANAYWMLGHESCKTLWYTMKNTLCFLIWVWDMTWSQGEQEVLWTEHLKAEAPCPSVSGLFDSAEKEGTF